MNIVLVFDDWRFKSKSIYSTEKGVQLSLGDFHSGSSFLADITLSHETAVELTEALMKGYRPVFYAYPTRYMELFQRGEK